MSKKKVIKRISTSLLLVAMLLTRYSYFQSPADANQERIDVTYEDALFGDRFSWLDSVKHQGMHAGPDGIFIPTADAKDIMSMTAGSVAGSGNDSLEMPGSVFISPSGLRPFATDLSSPGNYKLENRGGGLGYFWPNTGSDDDDNGNSFIAAGNDDDDDYYQEPGDEDPQIVAVPSPSGFALVIIGLLGCRLKKRD
jgi:hypothetical protein